MYVYRLLAREGINAEQLARDLKSFELKVPLKISFAIYLLCIGHFCFLSACSILFVCSLLIYLMHNIPVFIIFK